MSITTERNKTGLHAATLINIHGWRGPKLCAYQEREGVTKNVATIFYSGIWDVFQSFHSALSNTITNTTTKLMPWLMQVTVGCGRVCIFHVGGALEGAVDDPKSVRRWEFFIGDSPHTTGPASLEPF